MGVAARKFLFFGLEDVSLISLFFLGGGVGGGGLWRVFLSCLEKGFSPVFGGLFRERRGKNLSRISHKVFFGLTINIARFPLLKTLLYYISLVSCPPFRVSRLFSSFEKETENE